MVYPTFAPYMANILDDSKLTTTVAQVRFDVNSPEWTCIVDFVLAHRGDIESSINDFDYLKPMLDYFNRDS